MTTESHDQNELIRSLVASVGGDPDNFHGRLVSDLIGTSLKMIPEGHDTGQLKLVTSALKEMRYAYRVFNKYVGTKKISIFGSARTPPEHPDYIAARDFSRALAEHGWMSITGAGDGIMKAGHEGSEREGSFGLSIRLPFETTANEVIEGDPKLINFRYFFTRKLMFLSHADAVAVFPGGFGTQDELFESLVLIQTGKSNIVPVVLLEGQDGSYWSHWETYVRKNLLDNGWISPDDVHLYHMASDPMDALEHVLKFYRVYHSSRYVGDDLVVRVTQMPSDDQIQQLNDEFAVLVRSGRIYRSEGPLKGEQDHPQLGRIVFTHTRNHFAIVRRMIDRMNEFGDATPARRPMADAG